MRFKKVDFSAFLKDVTKQFPHRNEAATLYAWENIKLPQRQTKYSAGYDICTPIGVTIPPMERRIIPTGIKVVFNEDEMNTWHLQMYVRSSVGIKQGVILTNGTGIIDPDYQFSDNDGDMMLALMNTSPNVIKYNAGDRICQAVFCIHGLAEGDKANRNRTGGVGSTGR